MWGHESQAGRFGIVVLVAFIPSSQDKFADKIGFAQPTISGMFTEDKIPSSSVLLAVAKYYNVSVDWLFGLSERKELGGSVQAHNIGMNLVDTILIPALRG